MKRIILQTTIGDNEIRLRYQLRGRLTYRMGWYRSYTEFDCPPATAFFDRGEYVEQRFNDVKRDTKILEPLYKVRSSIIHL